MQTTDSPLEGEHHRSMLCASLEHPHCIALLLLQRRLVWGVGEVERGHWAEYRLPELPFIPGRQGIVTRITPNCRWSNCKLVNLSDSPVSMSERRIHSFHPTPSLNGSCNTQEIILEKLSIFARWESLKKIIHLLILTCSIHQIFFMSDQIALLKI